MTSDRITKVIWQVIKEKKMEGCNKGVRERYKSIGVSAESLWEMETEMEDGARGG